MSCECDKRLISPRSGVQIFTQLFTSDAIYCEGAHCAWNGGLIHQSLGLFAQATRRKRQTERESCKFYNIISDNFTHISHTRTHFNTVAKVLCMCFMIFNIDLFFTPIPPPYPSKGFFLELIKHSGIFMAHLGPGQASFHASLFIAV